MENLFRREQVIDLLSALVAIDSPYYQEKETLDFCEAWLKARGFAVTRQQYEETKITGFAGENLIVTLTGRAGGPRLCLNGHLDTVPLCRGWAKNPKGELVGERFYGLGAVDMKGGVAALLLALERFQQQHQADFAGEIVLTLVSDEEGPFGLGCNALIEEGLLPEIACSLITEPSGAFTGHAEPTIALGARGACVYHVDFYGVSAHASTPQQGLNAAIEAARFILASETLQLPPGKLGPGSFTVLKVEADGGACSVPDFCRVTIHRHIHEGENEASVLAEAARLCQEAGVSCRYEIAMRPEPSPGSRYYQPYLVAQDDPFARQLAEAVQDVCGCAPHYDYLDSIGDFNYLATRLQGGPALLFGPAGANLHGADEYVELPSLIQTVAVVYRFLERTLVEQP